MRYLIALLVLISVLIACSPTALPPTPTPPAAVQLEVELSSTTAATATSRPTTTDVPTETQAPIASPTEPEPPTPIPTNTPQATAMVVAQGALPVEQTGVVTRVIDGDTIEVRIGEIGFRVRYIGVNTTERGETCYQEGTDANAALVEGKTVQLIRDVSNTDRFGRLLRYVYVDDASVNAQLVVDGWAEAVEYPPDTRYAADFAALQAQARSTNIGCYALGVWGGTRVEPAATPVPATPIPLSPTPVPPTATEQKLIYYVSSGQNVNVRSEASTNAGILGALPPASSVEILDEVEGVFVLGSTRWYEVDFEGQSGYVHSSLLSDTPISTRPPLPTQRPQIQPAQQQPAQPQQPAAQPPAVQQPPAQQPPAVQQQPPLPPPPPEPPPPAAPAWTCDCSKTCTAMASCEEAYFQLNTCGCGQRDGDGDGVPCESICPGG